MFNRILLTLALIFSFSSTVFADFEFVGLGVVIQSEKKSIQIVDVFENSPASRADIAVGEWITAVDGKETYGKKLKDVTKWLRGDEGTEVLLTIQSGDRKSSRDIQLKREKILVKCFMDGQVNLNYYGYANGSGTLSGNVGDQSVNWQVSNGNVNAGYKGQFFNLNFAEDTNNNIRVAGWIGGTYVDWSGFNNHIYTQQSCIR